MEEAERRIVGLSCIMARLKHLPLTDNENECRSANFSGRDRTRHPMILASSEHSSFHFEAS